MTIIKDEELIKFFNAKRNELMWKDGLIVIQEPAHLSRELAHTTGCRPGRESAEYYAAGIALGEVNSQEGMVILRELRKMQVTDPEDSRYGAFYWYMEDTRSINANAAFFILMALVGLRLTRPNRIPAEHIPFQNEMMASALHWFTKECSHPILYYTNKILSDGALLLAIASLTDSEEHYRLALNFFARWEDYTERRGWGWGENCSVTYIRVILDALQTACIVLEQVSEQSGLHDRLRRRFHQLLDYVRFHGRHEFIPTIRSYNFAGNSKNGHLIWLLAGIPPHQGEESGSLNLIREINTLLLFENELIGEHIVSPVPRTRSESIFDGSQAYTWIGKHGRMGSINRFPVMPGCYQQDSWGLGWQSFPVSFCAENERVAYLRWFVKGHGLVRTHPAVSQPDGYLNTALFQGTCHPNVQTDAAQEENFLLVVRSLANVHHSVEEIADEWLLHRFEGKLELLDIDMQGTIRQWVVLQYGASSVAITALDGIAADYNKRAGISVAISQEQEQLRIRQVLYAGEERMVSRPRLETGWGVVFIDEPIDRVALVSLLSGIQLNDEYVFDVEIPREEHIKKREISLCIEGNKKVSLTVDPLKHEFA